MHDKHSIFTKTSGGTMPKTQNRAIMMWLFIFAFTVLFLVVFGGFVRLTRSGLSIVEWNPVSGALPPIGERAWLDEFSKYQLSPEYQKVNSQMTLEQYQRIFYIEWTHRLIARLAGFLYAIPALYFFYRGIIPRKEFGIYVVMGLLFISQAFMGWFMVASGLVDQPAVSHIRLTLHLILALALFGLSLWVAFEHRFGFLGQNIKKNSAVLSQLGLIGIAILIFQISYGGFTAGLKAGHLSNTWPLMFGRWIPEGLFSKGSNLLQSPQTILFTHRWAAFLALFFGMALYYVALKRNYPKEIKRLLLLVLGLGSTQIILGICVVLFDVQISLALVHQALAIILFGVSLLFMHNTLKYEFSQKKNL
jgi:cytochrome c oxidase assembly protein subunit 15